MRSVAPTWLVRAIHIACLENASYEFRDFIASLVILRAGDESVGIGVRDYFDVAMLESAPEMVPYLKNAREHSDSVMLYTLQAHRPPGLIPTGSLALDFCIRQRERIW